MDANGVEEMNSGYWQRQKLSTGQTALIQVEVPKDVMEAERQGSTQISNMMYNSLEGETATLTKKVAFNPEAFTNFSWAMRKGFLDKSDDFACAYSKPFILQQS